MNLSRACLATLILAPWLAVAGAVAVAHELVTRHGLWWVLAGCAALVAAFEVSTVAYRVLKARPVVSRAEAVRRLSRSSSGPPFGA
jgi:spore maturation protein SpmB